MYKGVLQYFSDSEGSLKKKIVYISENALTVHVYEMWTSENVYLYAFFVRVYMCISVRVVTPDLIVLVREPDQGSRFIKLVKKRTQHKIISAKLVKFLLRMFIKINAKEVNKKKITAYTIKTKCKHVKIPMTRENNKSLMS